MAVTSEMIVDLILKKSVTTPGGSNPACIRLNESFRWWIQLELSRSFW